MIAFPAGAKVWIAGGATDLRCGMNSLARSVQQGLGRDPHGGEIFCVRGEPSARHQSERHRSERHQSERHWRKGQHLPLNRQAERFAKEGVEISLSTLADHVGACAKVLAPMHDLIRGHVLAANRLQADDTTVPLLAKGGTKTARLWTCLRDDRPFAGGAPPAALITSRQTAG